MKIPLLLTVTSLLTCCLAGAGYRKVAEFPIGGAGGWDYLAADPETGRLYVSHSTEVDILDLKTGSIVGKIMGLTGVHGIAIAHDLKTGFISDGGANQVVSFDLATLQTKNKIKTGTNPDGIVYDAVSKRVFAFNGASKDATVINAATAAVEATIPLGGKPEFPVNDGQGNVFDNIEDTSQIVRIATGAMKVTARWSVAPCESPSGLAIDTAHRRLFSVCENKLMAVVNADSGKVIATPAIGEGPDAAAYDPGLKLAFASNGEGTLSVISQSTPDQYSVAATIPTSAGARTMTLDPMTHRLFLSTAAYAGSEDKNGRRAVVPGTFKILVLQQ